MLTGQVIAHEWYWHREYFYGQFLNTFIDAYYEGSLEIGKKLFTIIKKAVSEKVEMRFRNGNEMLLALNEVGIRIPDF